MQEGYIRPYRLVPFDIGCQMSQKEISAIMNGLGKQQISASDFVKAVSVNFISAYNICEDIVLYLFSFGIGIFVIRDIDFQIGSNEKFAIEYCRSRRLAHNKILKFESKHSVEMYKVIHKLREACSNNGKRKLRCSASDQWESKGLSYVMTVSYVVLGNSVKPYEDMSTDLQRSIHIMLQPSIVHEEDSEIIRILSERDEDPYNVDITKYGIPKNYWNSGNAGIYISWAAVIVLQKCINTEYVDLMIGLEVGLQAVWFYTYCLYNDLRYNMNKNILPSKLKQLRNKYNMLYNEFISNDDSSIPVYVSGIKQGLVDTSGIDHERDKLIEYLDCCIDENESIQIEKQRRYSWLNEILLFIIAYADIVTTLFPIFAEKLSKLGLVCFIVSMVVVFIFGVLFIFRKG